MQGAMNKTTERRNPCSLDGLLLLDKPVGLTSNSALQKVKKLFRSKKAGHTGSLDPLASGMLPVCFGEATKFSRYLLTAHKCYRVTATLGIRTITGDSEGNILSEKKVPPLTLERIDSVLSQFRGEIQQVPPMYSALKYKGQPLYELARQGIEVVRKSRGIKVDKLILLNFQNHNIEFELHCSKGTYVRTMVDDLGEMLDCGAHVSSLRRLTVGSYSENDMVNLSTLEEAKNYLNLNNYVKPIRVIVSHFPTVEVTSTIARSIRQGQAVRIPVTPPTEDFVQIVQKNGNFLGVAQVLKGGKIAPHRLLKETIP